MCLARRKLPDGVWQHLRFADYDFRSDDAHNTISLGLCPKDGTIHLAFDHHGHPLHYRVSQPGVATDPQKVAWEPSLFGPITSELEAGKRLAIVTYPRFWRTPDGGLQFCYRIGGSGNGDRMLVDYCPESGSWQHTRQIDSREGTFTDRFNNSPSRCSYPNGYTYDAQGRLHVTWVWRERTQGANHDLMYAYSEDRGFTWRNTHGQLVADSRTPDQAIRLDSPSITVVPIGREHYLMNTHGQAVDSHGRIHTVMWHATDASLAQAQDKQQGQFDPADARRYHHYWRGDDGTWHHTELPGVTGTRQPRKRFASPFWLANLRDCLALATLTRTARRAGSCSAAKPILLPSPNFHGQNERALHITPGVRSDVLRGREETGRAGQW